MRKSANRVVRDPMASIIQRSPLADDQQIDLGNAYHMALQAILRGYGDEQTWSTLACALNIAMLLCEAGFNAGNIQKVIQGQQALVTCRNRAQKFNRYAFTGDEAKQVMSAVAIHDEQLANASTAQVKRAINTLHERIDAGEVMA